MSDDLDDVIRDDFGVVYSVRLIGGEQLLTEIDSSEEHQEEGMLIVVNPMSISFKSTSSGEVTVAREFDPFTDESSCQIPYSNLLYIPNVANEFHTIFYVKSVIHAFIRRINAELVSDADQEDIAELRAEAVDAIKEFTENICDYFGVDIAEDMTPTITPQNTLH